MKRLFWGAVFLGLFFDGTGNNFEEDFKKHKQSNVVRMWMAHRDKSQNGRGATTYYDKAYIPGVGTKFPEIGETESTGVIPMLGKGGALGGAARIYWGLIQAINRLPTALEDRAQIQQALLQALKQLSGQEETLLEDLHQAVVGATHQSGAGGRCDRSDLDGRAVGWSPPSGHRAGEEA